RAPARPIWVSQSARAGGSRHPVRNWASQPARPGRFVTHIGALVGARSAVGPASDAVRRPHDSPLVCARCARSDLDISGGSRAVRGQIGAIRPIQAPAVVKNGLTVGGEWGIVGTRWDPARREADLGKSPPTTWRSFLAFSNVSWTRKAGWHFLPPTGRVSARA